MKCSAILLALGASGCAAQVTYGPDFTATERVARALDVTATMQAFRRPNVVIATRAQTQVDHGLVLRSGILHAGVDITNARSRFAVEPGLDLGLGGPTRPRYDGTGAYTGGAVTFRFRAWGGDLEPSYNIAFPFCDLVVLTRHGFWMGPEGSGAAKLYQDFAAELGFRIGFGSDMASTEQGRPPNRIGAAR